MTMMKGDSISHALRQVPATLELLDEKDAVAQAHRQKLREKIRCHKTQERNSLCALGSRGGSWTIKAQVRSPPSSQRAKHIFTLSCHVGLAFKLLKTLAYKQKSCKIIYFFPMAKYTVHLYKIPSSSVWSLK